MIVLKQYFSTTAGTRAGILILPDDITTNPDKVPLIVFSHGTGEAANGDISTVDSLYNNGSPLALARDGKLNNIIDPVTGKGVRFAAFGLQGTRGWCVQAVDQIGVIKSILSQYPNLDANAVVKTGLSAGGQVTWEAIAGPSGDLFLAGVPMSTPQTNPLDFKSHFTAKVWAFHGTADGGLTAYQNSINYVDQANGAKPGVAYLTSYNCGHGCWDIEYNVTDKVKLPDNSGSKTLNIYEWILQLRNTPNYLFTASGTSTGSGGSQPPPPPMTTKATPIITVVQGTGTFDSSQSIVNGGSTPSSLNWSVSPAVTWDTGTSGGANLVTKKATGMRPNSTYTITLSVYDKYGGSNTSPVQTVILDATGNGSNSSTPIPLPIPGCSQNSAPVDGSTLTTQTTATLNWGAVSGASSYDIYLYTGSTIPTTPTANITGLSYNASNLQAGVTYIWYVVPKNASGSASGCPKSSFQTASVVIPPAKILVSTTYVGTKKINVYSDTSVETI